MTCKSTIKRDDDEPELHCELGAEHTGEFHRRGNVCWYDPFREDR